MLEDNSKYISREHDNAEFLHVKEISSKETESSLPLESSNSGHISSRRKMSAAYYREYRKLIKNDSVRNAHYLEVSRKRKAKWRDVPGWRAIHEPYHKAEELPPIPALHTGHKLFDDAKRIVAHLSVKPDRRTKVYSDIYEELVSVAVLALLEGKNAYGVTRNYLTNNEYAYKKHNSTGSYKSWITLELTGNNKE